MSRFLLIPLLLLAGAVPAAAQTPPNAATAAPSAADERLRKLYNEEWAWRRKEFGRLEGTGPGSLADHLPRVSPAAQQARLAYWTKVLAELDRIPLAELSAEERINAAVFRTSVEAMANDIRFRTYEIPFNSDSFFWADLGSRGGLQNAEEYRRYIARLRDIPRYFGEHTQNMRAGLERGFSNPRVTLAGRERTIDAYLANGETNPLYAPFKTMPSNIPAEEQARLRQEAMAAIRESAIPAYTRLLAFLRDDYMPGARTSLAASQLPSGPAYYQAMLRKFTTLDVTADEIHRTGLSEVARIKAEMEATKDRAGFKGTLPEFIHFLRTDPQFYAKTPRELLATAAYVVKKADGKLRETFNTLPRYRHGVEPVPDAIAPIYTSGRGGLEACWFNTYNLPTRPLYQLPALALHECTPGHSFQAALALEGPDRPDFRKETYFSGYGEGWGLYTEWLGTVMGIYETPYEDFGRLSY